MDGADEMHLLVVAVAIEAGVAENAPILLYAFFAMILILQFV